MLTLITNGETDPTPGVEREKLSLFGAAAASSKRVSTNDLLRDTPRFYQEPDRLPDAPPMPFEPAR
jgi:hypothetical protein